MDLAKGLVFADPLLWQMMSHQEKKKWMSSWLLLVPESPSVSSLHFAFCSVLSWGPQSGTLKQRLQGTSLIQEVITRLQECC